MLSIPFYSGVAHILKPDPADGGSERKEESASGAVVLHPKVNPRTNEFAKPRYFFKEAQVAKI